MSLLEAAKMRTPYEIPVLDLTAPYARHMKIAPHISTNTIETDGFDSPSGHIPHSTSQHARPRTNTNYILENDAHDGKTHQEGIHRGRSPTVRGHVFVTENSK